MTSLPDETLKKLKCTECECYLSCAPIYLKKNGGSVCGRCFTPNADTENGDDDNDDDDDEERKRYHQVAFENLLKTYTFPCRYCGNRCDTRFQFSLVEQHENDCEYRPRTCLVSSPDSCNWSGKREKLYEHCVEEHPQHVLDKHPIVFAHDMTVDSCRKYITKVGVNMFLIQIKICVTSSKINHTVQWLSGVLKNDNGLKYTLTAKRASETYTKQCNILPYSETTTNEDTPSSSSSSSSSSLSSISYDFNFLSTALGGLDGTEFTINIDNNRKTFNLNVDSKNVSTYKNTKFCANSNKGCTFTTTISNELLFHNRSLCSYNTSNVCMYCFDPVGNTPTDNLITHLKKYHPPDCIRKENEYYTVFFQLFYPECNMLISSVIKSQHGKFIFICDKKTWKIRM